MTGCKRFLSSILLSMFIITIAPSMVVHATESETGTPDGSTNTVQSTGEAGGRLLNEETGDAISDIMDGQRFKGAISSIEWFTSRVDTVSIMVISGAAFFIICAAFLKNVCAGVYCSNSKFFDKVDDAHKKAEALSIASIKGYFGGGQFQNTSYGAFRDSLLALVPNFKAFTEFEDADIEPKQYFLKSIPQMLFCVIIGIYIYNGYYRDTAMKVGEFGSEAFERVMMSADPVALLDKLSQTTGTPDSATDYLTTPEGKVAKSVAHDIYSKIITTYTDISSEKQKAILMGNIDDAVIAWVNTLAEASGGEGEDGSAATSIYYRGEDEYLYARSTHVKISLGYSATAKDAAGVRIAVFGVGGSDGVEVDLLDQVDSEMKQGQVQYITAVASFGDVDFDTAYSPDGHSIIENPDRLMGSGGVVGGGSQQAEWATTTEVVQVVIVEGTGQLPATTVNGYTVNYSAASSRGSTFGDCKIYKNGTVKTRMTENGTCVGTNDRNTPVYAVGPDGMRYHVQLELNIQN